jgi:hypothetical protein
MEMFTNDVVIDHQDRCCYCPQSCPVPAPNFQKCSWTGNYDQVKNHLKEKHREECYDNGEKELRTVKRFYNVGSYFKFIFAFNEIFYQLFVRRGDTFYVSVHYIGHIENAAKYKYKVEFVNTDNTEGYTVMHLTRSFDKKTQKTGNCGKLHYDVVSHLTNENGDLNYKIEIFKVGV